MSLRRFNPRRDEAEPGIVEALVMAGASVHRLSAKDAPDLLVGWKGRNLLMEVKTPRKAPGAPSKRRKAGPAPDPRSEGQLRWAALWRGSSPVVVTTPQEALAVLLNPEAA